MTDKKVAPEGLTDVSIDISTERLITPADYTRMRPPGRNGRPMNIATAYRHIFNGVRGIRLEHVKIGGRTYTSVEAVQRFVDRLTRAGGGGPDPAPAPTVNRGHERAEQELAAKGI